ncbi:MAG: histidinol-phosphate transaminase [Candidatus Promineifilaceae bacterium]|nr:histidinol-phosphate transaminase [Candidatus Promineifilaceae bacterium]
MSTFDPDTVVRPDIAAMEPYEPIVPFEVLSERLGRPAAEIVKLDANENVYGPSPGARAALAEAGTLHIYPDPEANALRDALAQYTGVSRERLLAGAGADELIDLVLRAILEPGDGVLNCPPSFGMYPFSTVVNRGKLIAVPRDPHFHPDLAGIEAAAERARAKVIFICSPNNPDGSVLGDEALRRLLRLPLLVILDEAYVEFSGGSRITWVREHENLVVLRTFSKWAGLAGLRVGYGAFPEWLMPHLWKIKQPYNVNVAAEVAARASLAERAWLEKKIAAIVAERERLERRLGNFTFLRPFPSRSNFVLCRVRGRDARELKRALELEGILVRYFAKPGLDNCIRISAGRPADTDRLLATLERLA